MKNLNKRSKSIIRITLLTLAALIIGVNVYAMNASRLAGNTVPMPFGVGAAVVLSGSMEPELSVGDLLIIAERENYDVGDIVVYQDAGMLITHRIISVEDDEIVTKGDANNTQDRPISREQIKGKVVAVIPLIGYLVNVMKTPVGTLAILIITIWLMECSFRSDKKKNAQALDEIKSEIEKLKKEQDKNENMIRRH